MTIKLLSNWIESAGMLAIIIALIFVALQIRQDHVLVRSELGAGTTENLANIFLNATEADFAKTFAKMVNEPDQLTDDEMIQIEFFLQAVKTSFVRECYLKARGVFDECKNMIHRSIPRFFGRSYAKNWWLLNSAPHPYIPDWVNDEIAGLSATTNLQYLEQLKKRL